MRRYYFLGTGRVAHDASGTPTRGAHEVVPGGVVDARPDRSLSKEPAVCVWPAAGGVMRRRRVGNLFERVPSAGRLLDTWCTSGRRSTLEPITKVAKSLRRHRNLILNWFRAQGTISAGVVEGLNGVVKLMTRKAFGFRTAKGIEIALFHGLRCFQSRNQPTDSAEEAGFYARRRRGRTSRPAAG